MAAKSKDAPSRARCMPMPISSLWMTSFRLDAHVAKDVFNKCVRGVFREKAVLLVTHQLHFVERADKILVMKDGEVVERGSYKELIENAEYFRQMMESYR